MAQSAGTVGVDAASFGESKDFMHAFLDSEQGSHLTEKLREVADDDSGDPRRIIVSIDALRRYNPHRTDEFIHGPLRHMTAFREAVHEKLDEMRQLEKTKTTTEVAIGFNGSFGSQHVSPRGLQASCLSSMICVEGIVTKASQVQPKVVKSTHYCETTKQFEKREYRDAMAVDLGHETGGGRPRTQTSTVFPKADENGNPLDTEYGLSEYKDHQCVTIQEMPERAPMGQLPRSVDLILDYDLVDKVKPGDRVQAVGIYRALPGSGAPSTSGVFRTVVLANHVATLGRDVLSTKVTPKDLDNIRTLANSDDPLSALGRALAPSICGHDYIKKALVLQLISGSEKNLENGTHLRGDINILMVGDPSTAKSQLLRSTMGTAPLAVSTTGRGSSGVGLTAAVTSDPETGERRLEAGAMVLADRGVVCIDEFDKMSEADRVAIHEVMEQQTVTIAKAGIHASLNARCAVLAAANPVYGKYDRDRRPQENIALPDSLLSRFDLLFIVLDQPDPEFDRTISDHVLRAHQYRRPGADKAPEKLMSDMLNSIGGGADGADDEEEDQTPMYVGSRDDILTKDFLRKYIMYAKNRDPKLMDDAREMISSAYADLRAKAGEKTLPVTARSLETMIRLSTAHAKVRLSSQVEEVDCQAAIDLMQFALYHEIDAEAADPSVPRSRDEADKENRGMDAQGDAKPTRKRPRNAPEEQEADGAVKVDPTSERFQLFANAVTHLLVNGGARDTITVGEVLTYMHEQQAQSHRHERPYRREEADAILEHLEEDNRLMYDDGVIHYV